MVLSGTMVFYGASMASDSEMQAFTIRIPAESYDILTKVARREMRSKTSLIATILVKYTKEVNLEDLKDKSLPHLET